MSCNEYKNDKIKEIPNRRCCIPTCICIGPTGPTGATGVTGPAGPAGNNANSTACFCVDQMRNIIQQIITLYPNDNLIIAMESGNKGS